MRQKRRNIKKYKPRPKMHTLELQKQQLGDMEHLLNLDLGSLLVLTEEGTEKQKLKAREKLISHIRKYGGDMEKLAQKIGPEFNEATKDFIKNLRLLAQESDLSDQEKIANYQKSSALLEKIIKSRHGPA